MERRALHLVNPFLWPSRVRKLVAHAPGARLSGDDGKYATLMLDAGASCKSVGTGVTALIVGSLFWFNAVCGPWLAADQQ